MKYHFAAPLSGDARDHIKVIISCSCGKQCKGLRGLKVHQRSCGVVKLVSDNFTDNLENDYNALNDDNNFDINVDNNLLGGDYMIPVGRDEILSRFTGISAVL